MNRQEDSGTTVEPGSVWRNPKLHVILADGRTMQCEPGTAVGSLAPVSAPESGLPYLGALVNHDECSLSYPLSVNCRIRFLTVADPHGWRIGRRSLCFLLAKTVRSLFPDVRFSIDHSFGVGLYCTFDSDAARKAHPGSDPLRRLDAGLRALIDRNVPIERRKVAYADAMREFELSGQTDKLNLLRHRNPPHVVVHWCEEFSDLAHGALATATGALPPFELIPYPPGFVLHVGRHERAGALEPFEDQPHLFRIFQEHRLWGKILGLHRVGRLNELILKRKMGRFVEIAEALHEKKISRIADRIHTAREPVGLILIAGPSCAGKTTFSKRLTTQLTVNGIEPHTISVDNYFVGEERNPLDEHGRPDYEHIEAVDIDLFNEHLLALLRGAEVKLPRFDFTKKKQEYRGETMRIGPGQPLIVEGIHALNPQLTPRVPDERKFRIYVSALTQLSLDVHNRLSTTDNRLMRRIVRDNFYRGYSALDTLRRWPSVRQGEKRWIFPFQREADATFNSALDYELAVLKGLVEPLLAQIKPTEPEYAEARRLSEFLLNFLPASDRHVPTTSILREYIGGSTLEY